MKIRSTVILFVVFALALLIFAGFQWLGIKTGDESRHAERFVFPSLNPFNPRSVAADQPMNPAAAKDNKGPQTAQPKEFSRLVIERYRNDSKKAEKLEFNNTTVGTTPQWVLVAPVKVRTDDAAVTSLLNLLITLEKQKSKEAGRDLAALGLDKPDVLVTLTKGDKDYTLSLGKTGPATKDPIYFATSSEQATRPFLLTKSKIDKLFDEINVYRDKALISSAFGQVNVQLGGTARAALELNKEKEWVFKEPALGQADTPATEEFIRQLAGIKIEQNQDYVSDNTGAARLAELGLSDDKPEYSFTLTQSPVGPQDKAKVEKILIGKPDETAARQAAQTRTAAFIIESLFAPTSAAAAYVVREKQKVEPAYYYARLAGDQTVIRIPARHLPLLKKSADELRVKALAKLDNSRIDAVTIKTPAETMRIYRADLQAAASWELYTENRAKVKCQPMAIQTLLDAITRIEIRDTRAFLDDDARIRAWFGDATIDLGLDKPQSEITLWQDGLMRDLADKLEGQAEPKIKDELKAKPTMKLFIGKKDDQRKVTYVRREVPGCKPVILAVPDPFVAGNATAGAMQSGAVPPDGRQTFSINSLAGQGYLAYRDRALPSYRLDQISTMEVKREGIVYALERTDTKDEKGNIVESWKLKQPVEGIPNTGIPDYIASNVVGMSSDKLITDRATEKDLDEAFGLIKSPLLQVMVKTRPGSEKPVEANSKDAPKPVVGGTYTYTIGKKVTDTARYPNHYYARLETKLADGTTPDSNQFVMAVPLSFVQSLDIELRNVVIYPDDTGKPTSLQLTWNGETADKKPTTSQLNLTLANDKWEVTSYQENGTDAKAKLAKLDQNKINALLRYGPQPAPGGPCLNPFAVDRFVQHQGKLDPKYQLEVAPGKSPLLLVQVNYADGKNRVVHVGAALKPSEAEMPVWGGASFYYAATPTLPGTVMLINENNWRDLVAGAMYFAEAPAKPRQ